MSTRDEVLRFLVETKGDQSLVALANEILAIGKAGDQSEAQLKGLLDQVANSDRLAAAAAKYREVGRAVLETGRELAAAQDRVKAFAASLDGEPTRKQTAELEKLRREVSNVAGEYERQKSQLSTYRAQVIAAGGSITQLAAAEKQAAATRATAVAGMQQLAGSMREQSTAAAALRARLAEQDEVFKRLNDTNRKAREALAAYRERAAAAGQSTGELDAKAKALDSSLKRIESQLTGIGAGLVKLNAGLQVAERAFGAVSNLGFGDALEQTGKLEDSLAALQAVTNASAGEFDLLRAAAEGAVDRTRFSAQQAAAGLTELARAGLGAREAIDTLNPSLNLAQGNAISVSKAAELLTTTVTQFGEASSEAARIADVLQLAADSTSTSVEQMGLALSYSAPLARQLNLTVEQTAAIIGELANQGFRGERAGTALRNVFSQLLDPSSAFSSALREAGIQSTDFGTVLEQLAAKGEAGKRALMALDSEARPAILALVNTGGRGLASLTAALEASEGAAKRTADIMGGTLNAAMDRFNNTLDLARDRLLDPLLEPLADELESLQKQLATFIDSDDFDALAQQVKDFVLAGVGALREFLGEFDFSAAVQALRDFLAEASGYLRSFSDNVEVVAGAVQKLAAGTGAFVDTIRAGWNGIQVAVEGAALGVGKAIQGIGVESEFVDSAVQTLGENARADLEEMGDAADGARRNVAALAGSSSEAAESTERLAESQTKLENATPKVEQLAKGYAGLAESTQSAFDQVEAFARLTAAEQQNVVTYADKIANLGVQIARTFATGFSFEQLGQVRDAVGEVVEGVGQLGEKAESAAAAAATAFKQVSLDATASADQILAAFKTALETAVDPEQIARFGELLTKASTDGRISLEQLDRAFVQIRNRTEELVSGTEDLKKAFIDLGLKSQAEIENTARLAETNFETIRKAAESGKAGIEDVRRAFVAYARAQLDAVKDSDAFKRQQVEALLAQKAEVLGVTEALKALGIAGKDTGEKVVSGMDDAAESLSKVREQAEGAADGLSDVEGSASAATGAVVQNADAMAQGAANASDYAVNLGAVSAEFAEQLKFLDQINPAQQQLFNERVQEQRMDAGKRVRALEEELALYDPIAKRVKLLRDQYDYLDDGFLRSIAEREERLEQARLRSEQERKRAAEDSKREREREQISGTSNSGGGSASNGAAESRRVVEILVKNEQGAGQALTLSDADRRRIVDAVLREIELARQA